MPADLITLRHLCHYGGHLVIPWALARIFFPDNWKGAGMILLATMAIDLDHLLATPVFDPTRCSLNVHLLHSPWAALVYTVLLVVPRWPVRAFMFGALWHLCTDAIDCRFMGVTIDWSF